MTTKKTLAQVVEEIQKALVAESYLKAKDLSSRLHVATGQIYRAVRVLRERKNIGVEPTKKGYVLAELATKRDDLGFLRRVNGRRTSDMVAISAALPHIEHRWHSITDRKNLRLALGGLVSSPKVLGRGLGVVKLLEGKKAIK